MPARPELVALYATAMADGGRKVWTIERAVTQSLRCTARAESTSHGRTRRSLRCSPGSAAARRDSGAKAPVADQELVMLFGVGDDVADYRDRHLALGWFGAFRRAEIVSLDVGDVERSDEGLVVTLRRSKGD